MCNCGRTRDVQTSANVQAALDAQNAPTPEEQQEALMASAANAMANSNTGWYLTGAE